MCARNTAINIVSAYSCFIKNGILKFSHKKNPVIGIALNFWVVHLKKIWKLDIEY